ncbi:MAG: hypothetical protein IH830_04165 [Planctomycetes bacterium]|nr:hypothetical protein [Planctomycetota bacterium]
MRSRKHLYLAAATAAVTGLAGVSFAALLGVLPGFPNLNFNALGTTSYSPITGLFSVDSCPIAIVFVSGDPPRFVTPTGEPASEVVSIIVGLDRTGTLIGRVTPSDLVVIGEVDPDGAGPLPPIAGTLLTGEAAEFGFEDTGTATDVYDFRFTVTGGLLADAFFAGKDIGVIVTSEGSTFTGDFTVGFGGGGKGVLGPIALLGGTEGCTPGYWKQTHHFDSWPAPFLPDDLFEVVFERDVFPKADPLLSEALRLRKGGLNALMRHATAALLNAASPNVNPDPGFDTPEEVIAAFQAAFDDIDPFQIEITKDLFEDSNDIGCPLN